MSASIVEIIVTSFLFFAVVSAIGCVPIYYVKNTQSLGNEKYLGILSLFGVGMLLGTAFMLVIPEGISACLEHEGNVGVNLLMGFLVVYALDRVASMVSRNSAHIRWCSFLQERCELESLRDILKPKKVVSLVVRNQVVFALVVHGFSDGLAMGASTNNDSVKVATLAAIIIHKIPAVLSLSSLMVTKQKLPTLEAISNLLAFAASTPLAYFVVSLINMENWGPLEWISGNVLLMSGGSLLYAAVSALSGNHKNHETYEYSETEVNLGLEPTALDINYKDMTPFQLVDAGVPNASLPYDESVYVLCGVIVPVVVSYIIREKD
ncbi:LADA_0A00980g1_1 [Lachancea dasiensis]|uniref:LADA_0A00980g1_1 n=1 Tax=Lachancea dasiensis TaxID=1072105 RepID=A0A1G4ILV9_9SACH|nr:LADA_0A00980g1_1 [Lachancea dasiensis]